MSRARTGTLPLPLTAIEFEILIALCEGARHGYAILQDVRERAEGSFAVRPGTLYRAIHRLMEKGILMEAGPRPAPDREDERRRYYELTAFGREIVAAEARRLRNSLVVARTRSRDFGFGFPGGAS